MKQMPLPLSEHRLAWYSPRRRPGDAGAFWGHFLFWDLEFVAENNLGDGFHTLSHQRRMLSRSCWQPAGIRPQSEEGATSWRL